MDINVQFHNGINVSCWNSWGRRAREEKFTFVTLPRNEWIGTKHVRNQYIQHCIYTKSCTATPKHVYLTARHSHQISKSSTFPSSGSAGADTSLDSDSSISIGDDGCDLFFVHYGF